MVNYKQKPMQISLDSGNLELINKIKESRKGGNFQTVRKTIGDGQLINLLNNLYPKHDMKTLENLLGIPDSSLGYWFKQLGIPVVRNHVNNRVFAANFDFSFVLPVGNGATNFSAINVKQDLAYLAGFCLGDGSVDKHSLEVFNKDFGMKDYLKSTMAKFGKVGESKRSNGLWRLRLSSSKIARLIKEYKKANQDTIDFIFSNDELAKSFIAGFWDAEGSVLKQKKYFHVYLYNSDKNLIFRISAYLKSKEINNSVLEMKKRENKYFLKGRPVIAKKTIWRLGVKKNGLKIWVELIGLHLKHSKKSVVVKQIAEELV